MTDRDVGGMGEAEFTKWCNSIGLAANKFHEDKTGKDFLVEFPLDKDAKHIHEAAITARIQVKSTDGKRRGEQITLSNLKRLATEPGPSFIAFIEFDGQDDPQQAFLVHINKKWISKILKRIQETNNPDPAKKAKKKKKPKRGKRGPKKKPSDSKALNKTTIKVKYDKKHRLSKPNGQSLKTAIQSAVPNGIHAYVEAKQKHLKSTGWEETYGSFTFSVADEKNITGLVDVSLGLEECILG